MNPKILAFIEKLEVFKSQIKALHWDSNSLSQHELCDDISDLISEFQDQVSEVEQSISGKLPKNMFKPTNQNYGEIGSLKEFVEKVLKHTNEFYKVLNGMGDDYIGMRSDCESFLSEMQRKLYLVNFTLKEALKNRLRGKIVESRPKNPNVGDIDKFMGRRPKTMKGRINQIYKIVKMYGIDSRLYSDDHWQAIEDYYRAITSLGCEVEMKPCGNLNNVDSMESDGGYCDYDPHDHMPRSKQYAIRIMFADGMAIDGYIKCMAAGTMEDPFSRYDTCIILWPRQNKVLEEKDNSDMRRDIRLNDAELKALLRESVVGALSRIVENRGSSQDWYAEEDYDGNVGQDGMIRSYNIGTYYVDQAEVDDKDCGYDDVAEYLKYWFSEIQMECPWYWVEERSGYGHNGSTICEFGNVRIKDIFGQIMVDEYPPYDGSQMTYESKKNKTLCETPLNYDIDNFSGRWNKNVPDDYIDGEREGYFDDPNRKGDIEYDLDDYASSEGDTRPMKDIENDYSWGLYDNQPIALGVNKAISMRKRDNDWADRELRHRDKVMGKYVNGKYDGEDVGDAWDDLHYESKEPMKVTESELKAIVKEAAMQFINEHNQRMTKKH